MSIGFRIALKRDETDKQISIVEVEFPKALVSVRAVLKTAAQVHTGREDVFEQGEFQSKLRLRFRCENYALDFAGAAYGILRGALDEAHPELLKGPDRDLVVTTVDELEETRLKMRAVARKIEQRIRELDDSYTVDYVGLRPDGSIELRLLEHPKSSHSIHVVAAAIDEVDRFKQDEHPFGLKLYLFESVFGLPSYFALPEEGRGRIASEMMDMDLDPLEDEDLVEVEKADAVERRVQLKKGDPKSLSLWDVFMSAPEPCVLAGGLE